METVFLQRLDVYPYRHRVAEVMARPPVTAPPDTSLAEAGRRMSHDQISSLVVVDEAGRPRGLLTEREVVQALGRHGAAAAALPLSAVMSRPVPTIRDDSFVYTAIGRMDRLKLRHLVAVDERGRVTGMVTVGRLLHLRASTALVIGDQLSLAERASEMACIRVGLPALASTLLAEGVPPAIIVAVISSVLRDMTARAAELAEQGMRAD
ncbi:MAG: CBS domain-containing protein, partial [Rhodospirillales bacterium]|nr:CBS domain-containing protein [Rhodospirillales bacterium]